MFCAFLLDNVGRLWYYVSNIRTNEVAKMAYTARTTVEVNKLDDMEIMNKIRGAEKEWNIRLTIPQRRFFLRLVDYAVENGTHSDSHVTIYLTEREMAEKFSLSLSMVNKCMVVFREAGLIIRESRSCAPRGKNTIIPKMFYKKEKENG